MRTLATIIERGSPPEDKQWRRRLDASTPPGDTRIENIECGQLGIGVSEIVDEAELMRNSASNALLSSQGSRCPVPLNKLEVVFGPSRFLPVVTSLATTSPKLGAN
jgi:hypothetical protein